MTHDGFEALVSDLGEVTVDSVERLARGAKGGDPKSIEGLGALLARVAFITPEATNAVYDALARTWLGLAAGPYPTPLETKEAMTLLSVSATLPAQFWTSFWGIIRDGARRISAEETTVRVAALAVDLPWSFHERAEVAAHAHPGVSGLAGRGIPAPIKIETLAGLPSGSLGHDFYRLVVDKKFDLEVLDRRTDGVRSPLPGLHYLNVRMLQMHDIWHLAAGYTTSALHENALSSFQLAQCGHNYSAMYLATVVLISYLSFPDAFEILLQVIAEAWQHSRQSPSLMNIDWENEWHRPVEEVRRRHGIKVFESIYADDLFEQGVALENHPVFRTIRRMDSVFGTRWDGRLKRGALMLHVKSLEIRKRRARR